MWLEIGYWLTGCKLEALFRSFVESGSWPPALHTIICIVPHLFSLSFTFYLTHSALECCLPSGIEDGSCGSKVLDMWGAVRTCGKDFGCCWTDVFIRVIWRPSLYRILLLPAVGARWRDSLPKPEHNIEWWQSATCSHCPGIPHNFFTDRSLALPDLPLQHCVSVGERSGCTNSLLV